MNYEAEKISELDTLNTADNNDVLVINDISENDTKKITKQNLLKEVNSNISSSIQNLSDDIYNNVYTKSEIGNISALETTDKTTIVNSINELVEGQLGIKTNKILATPNAFLNAGQTYNFSDSVANQTNGIVLVWSAYNDGAPADYSWNITYVPKQLIALKPGAGVTCPMFGGGFQNAGCKYVYLTDTSVRGNAINEGSGTNSGISYNNSQYILRYVIGI